MENAKLFNNASIREHLLTCLNNSRLSKSQPCNEQKLRSRDTRQSLYNKVGVKQNVRLLLSVDDSFTFSFIRGILYTNSNIIL